MIQHQTPEIEITLLLEALFRKYGYDFRQYSRIHIGRRIANRMLLSNIGSISDVQSLALHDRGFAALLLQDLSITVTEMFRDPLFFLALREKVIPVLKTHSFVKIWHAGCSTGEEVYSMAILLKEEGLYDRTTIYATDFNQRALEQAREGIYTNEIIKEYSGNYLKSGGRTSLSDYYTSDSNRVVMDQSLKKNIVWANHNLVTDSVFAEVHLIICRNVLIYFDRNLQNRVQQLFLDSLIQGGILCLGSGESINFSNCTEHYHETDRKQRIYKKKYGFHE